MNRKVVIYAVLFVASVGLWVFMHSDKAQIKRVFSSVERIARREPLEPVIESVTRAQVLAAFFKEGCRFVVPEFGVRNSVSREGIAGAVMNLRTGTKNIEIRFRELEVEVDGAQAQVKARMDMAGTEATSFSFPLHPRTFIAHLEKIDGKWLISRIEIQQSQGKDADS